jgi:uncharacterized protein (TIGR01244 family)
MKSKFFPALLAVFTLFALRASGQSAPAAIPGFHAAGTEAFIGGPPSDDQLAKLKAAGIKTVIDLRLPSEHDAAKDAERAARFGLEYRSLPVDHSDPSDDAVPAFLKLLSEPASRPALVYCASGNRAAALWMIRRVLVDHMTVAEAEAEAETAGMKSKVMKEFAKRYIAAHREKPAKSTP